MQYTPAVVVGSSVVFDDRFIVVAAVFVNCKYTANNKSKLFSVMLFNTFFGKIGHFDNNYKE